MKEKSQELPVAQIDAFTQRPFCGNPAAVMVLDAWLPDATLQAIAAENNLAETAFLVRNGEGFHLRWFTPEVEVDLCGHATLASGHHVLNDLEPQRQEVKFYTRSGPLTVVSDGDRLSMDFPARPVGPASAEEKVAIEKALGLRVVSLGRSWAYVAELESEDAVRKLVPDIQTIRKLDLDLIVTARGSDCDFVSRFFGPKVGIPEDPVTGSAHCALAPFWSRKLGKNAMFARQVSKRGGEIWVEAKGERVLLAGHCAPVMTGSMRVPA